MNVSQQIAKHLRDVHFGGNWTTTNMRDELKEVAWQQAVTKVYDFNTIATLTYHTTYFVEAILKVLQGGPLDSKDKYSFDHPPIQSEQDWENLLQRVWDNAEQAAVLIEQLPEEKLQEPFVDPKYGTWYRNLTGCIEHMHYHLGQMVMIKKLMRRSL